jgi:PEP-CTERM motif
MKRLACFAVLLGLAAAPQEAAATPIEYHVTFALSTTGYDYLGVTGATFDLSVVLDPAIATAHVSSSGNTQWTLMPAVSSIRLNISGSAYDGLYASTYNQGSPALNVHRNGFALSEVGQFSVGGAALNLGSISATLPAWLVGPAQSGRIHPFAFEQSDVLAWNFRWADTGGAPNGPRSSYTPTIIGGHARPVGVPEPSTMLMLGIGIAGALAHGRRSRAMRR